MIKFDINTIEQLNSSIFNQSAFDDVAEGKILSVEELINLKNNIQAKIESYLLNQIN